MKGKTPTVENKQIAIIRDGKESPFWQTIKGIIEDERREINTNILAKESLGLTDEQVNDLIKWHSFLAYVVNLPDAIIGELETPKVNDGTEDEQYPNDPYELSGVREKITKNGPR